MDGEQESSTAGDLLVRSDVWFDDGTVVLQAEKTLFRVYRGVLAAQSPIFRDAFAIPQPAMQDTYEGCPLVVLHDSALELRIFLLATHDAGYFMNTPVDGLETLFGLVRLSTKYDVEHIRRRMVSILRVIYPSSLAEYLKRQAPAGYGECDEDDFLALRLAGEFNILPVLPGIYYECCRYQTGDLLEAEISFADKTKCLLARDAFIMKWSRILYRFLFHHPKTCTDRASCPKLFLRWAESKPLTLRSVLTEGFDWNLPLCDGCMGSAKGIYEQGRSRLWDALPGLFGLPSWEDLLADDAMA
ncbi:hypothetical protein C8R47DRAFT_1000600 [Mycena vitilis]|nr:hypothetical protein C8R47DRAFT_1000600 [Mycena vitilis]